MFRRNKLRVLIIMITALIAVSVGYAFAAAIVVPATRMTDQRFSIGPNQLKPAACSGITLNAIVICTGGKCNGTNANELILGTSGYDDISGKNGDDCILGGGGDDDIDGDNGTDVCIGGPGNDNFGTKCETTIQ